MIRGIIKKILLVVAFISFFKTDAFCQHDYMYYSGGYGYSDVNLDGLNYVIRSYNTQRTHLTRDLGELNLLHGFTVSGGVIVAESFLIELGFTQRRAHTFSNETLQGDQPFKRDLTANITTIGGGLGKYVFWQEGFKLLVGSTFEVGKVVLRTRLYNTNDATVPGYVDVGKEFSQNLENNNSIVGITPYAQFSYTPWGRQFEIVVKPYYQFQLKESDFRYVNQAWNSNTYQQDSPESTKSYANNFGIQLKLNVLMKIDI